jgi:hypothetical protein
VPSTLTVAKIVPAKVRVTFSGQRKAFAFLKLDDIGLVLQLWDARRGKHRFSVTSRDLSYPPGLKLEDIEPRQALLDIENRSADEKNNH